MAKRLAFKKADPYSLHLMRQAEGMSVRFRFAPKADPHRVWALLQAFCQFVAAQQLGITGGSSDGKGFYFVSAMMPEPGHLTEADRMTIREWLANTAEIESFEVGPIGETFQQAFG